MRASLLPLVVLWSVAVPYALSGQPEPAIHSTLQTVEIHSGRIDTIHREARHFEAPNWSHDGQSFIVNSAGRLYRLRADGIGGLAEIPTGFATRLNNAKLNSVATYYDLVPAFDRLLATHRGKLEPFYESVQELTRLSEEERHAHLATLHSDLATER